MKPASSLNRLEEHAGVRNALGVFSDNLENGLQLAMTIQQIPGPTFHEKERARWVRTQFMAEGLDEVSIDRLGNVYGRLPGLAGDRPPLILSAHTDTVFSAETDLSLRQEGARIYGPGIADNSMGVAGLIWLAAVLKAAGIYPLADIWFVANVCEEGLGDLKGMRTVVQRFGSEASYIVVEGGSFGHVIYQGIGVRRFQVTVNAPGGHSWADFGQASAIHLLGNIISEIGRLDVPRSPKTTYNVGVIKGGTSINTIAETAYFLLDLRSEGKEELDQLVSDVRQILSAFELAPQISLVMDKIGDRPAGGLSREHPLVRQATAALRIMGREAIEYGASSTDANIPLSIGAAAVCIGLAESGNVHRLQEYLDTTHLDKGMGQLLLLALSTAGLAASPPP